VPTARDIIIDAMTELNVVSPGESIDAALINKGLSALNRMIDSWATENLMIYARVFNTYTLIPGHQPHTLGPSTNTPAPDWVFGGKGDSRPVKINAASLLTTGTTPPSNLPINIRDAAWWSEQRVQQLTGQYPTDLYYDPAWPNGNLYFWPVPTVSRQVQLELPTMLTQFDLTTNFSMPPGYWDAVVWNLAVRLWPSMSEGEQLDPVIATHAVQAKAKVKSLNSRAPNITTGGDGLPGGRGGGFDWRIGMPVGRGK